MLKSELSYALYDLEPSTEYAFNVEACSQYGCVTGGEFSITTLPPGNIPSWGFDVQVTFAALGQDGAGPHGLSRFPSGLKRQDV